MPLQLGIIGLPQVGKSTIFNALTAAGAQTHAYSRADAKPNIGVAKVPDERLKIINQFIKTEKIIPATIQVVDVAGLVRGASTGEGLGNKFLSHVRDMDALLHVVRCFDNPEVAHVEESIDPVRDVDTVETELILADLDQVSTSLDKAKRAARGGEKEAVQRAEILEKAFALLNDGKPVRELRLTGDQNNIVKSMGMLTAKKQLFVANVGEDDIAGQSDRVKKLRERAAGEGLPVVVICGKLEAELSELGEADRAEMLAGMNLKEPALAALAREAYKLLGLRSFLTAGPKEIRAWTIPVGATAVQAAGAVHTDLEKSFIKAETYSVGDLEQYKSEAAIKQAGKMRLEGKEYVVQEGDVIFFRAGLAGRS
jgi:GTP-binding protein YchF